MNVPERPPKPSKKRCAPAPSVNGIEPVGRTWTGGKTVDNSIGTSLRPLVWRLGVVTVVRHSVVYQR